MRRAIDMPKNKSTVKIKESSASDTAMTLETVQHEFSVVPINKDFMGRARGIGVDDQGQSVEHHLAAGGEPCRDVLRRAKEGERIILASYCPFELSGPYKEFGPVFILVERAPEPAGVACLSVELMHEFFRGPFLLRAYSLNERIVDAILTTPQDAQADLMQLFSRDDVAFVLARFIGYGCYGFRIERRQKMIGCT